MNRRDFLKHVGLVSLCISGRLSAASESKPPNILFIFSDDHSLQTLGAYGSRMQAFIKKHKITPNIDRIAAEGVLFENSFVGNSICGPSRASLLTGKHSHLNGFKKNGDRFDPEQWTAVKALQRANYQTAVMGKWHLGTMPRGFDDYQVLPGQGTYYNPNFITKGSAEPVRKQGYCSDIIGDMTIDWLNRKRDESKPFFLCSWHKAPHRTWLPHPKHFRLLDGVDVPEPENLFDDYEGRTSAASQQEMTVRDHLNISADLKVTPPVATTPVQTIREKAPETKSMDPATFEEFRRMTQEQKKAWDAYYVPRNEEFKSKDLKGKELTRWKYQAYLKDYIKCIKAMDENVGRVLEYLNTSGLDKNTIVIYGSDQGFYNGEHGWYDKRWMYEESLRTPLIVKWPNVAKPGSRCKEMVQNIDYAPTLLEAAGVEIPEAVQGRSLVPLLRGEKPDDWRESILYTYYGNDIHAVKSHWGVRTERYKLIEFYRTGEWEFYDMKKDPLEMKSEYDNPEYQTVVQDMKNEFEKLKAQYQLEEPQAG
ncbi:Arylsulfatase [Anaerohalosphaera lusitana]|uniref:Arylsulfatase n=1 Tax=Anaerohalosphaera lusitana TaxID=1936003 RepID=A0A1U9NPV3_9BACT|nr:sulfatase [Anaerohalosphaera lusitana]AQT69817.1 Arylsulfatase [Anaerohalosphaera lusitana]